MIKKKLIKSEYISQLKYYKLWKIIFLNKIDT